MDSCPIVIPWTNSKGIVYFRNGVNFYPYEHDSSIIYQWLASKLCHLKLPPWVRHLSKIVIPVQSVPACSQHTFQTLIAGTPEVLKNKNVNLLQQGTRWVSAKLFHLKKIRICVSRGQLCHRQEPQEIFPPFFSQLKMCASPRTWF